jgi:hypothetical protein
MCQRPDKLPIFNLSKNLRLFALRNTASVADRAHGLKKAMRRFVDVDDRLGWFRRDAMRSRSCLEHDCGRTRSSVQNVSVSGA